MDFDHIDPNNKRYTVAQSGTCSNVTLLEEISKCDIVCANCHRIRTAKSGYPWMLKRRKARPIKSTEEELKKS